MAGEVIDMFGSGGKGPFGTGVGEVLDTEGEVVNPGPGGAPPGKDPAPAGDSPQAMQPAAALIQQLDIALSHARHAAHRLVDLVPPAALPEEQFDELHNTYGTIQANLGAVAQQVRAASSPDALLAANRNTREVSQQVQQYIEAVETVISQLGVAATPGAQLAPKPSSGNGLLLLALAIGAGAAGYGIWQLNKRRKLKKRA